MKPDRDRRWKIMGFITGHRAAALLATAVLAVVPLLAASTPAGAATAGRMASAGAMAGSTGRASLTPDGKGTFNGGCGPATLQVDSLTRDFRLTLQSEEGDITGGWYVIWTTGAFAIPNPPGGFKINGTTAVATGTVEFPGAFPGSALVTGVVKTIEGSCVIAVTAPWTVGF